MWLSFLDSTFERAIWWNDVANAVLILSLIVGVLATFIIVRTSSSKEEFLKRDLAVTQEQTAKANERAADSVLKLEQLRKQVGPRTLNRSVFLKALSGQPTAPVQILYLRDDPDSLEFAQEIENQLKQAKWSVISREPVPTPSAVRSGPEIPITMAVGGQPSGVTVVTHSVSEEESRASEFMIRPDWETTGWVKTPWTVLSNAFLQSMGRGSSSSHSTVPKGTLRVVVGPRR